MAESTIKLGVSTNQLTGLGLTLNGTALGSSFWKLDRIRILIIAGIGNPTANTVYTIGTVPAGNRPVLNSCATFTSVVSGSTKGYGRISVAESGAVSLVSSFSGNQEIMTCLVWIAAE